MSALLGNLIIAVIASAIIFDLVGLIIGFLGTYWLGWYLLLPSGVRDILKQASAPIGPTVVDAQQISITIERAERMSSRFFYTATTICGVTIAIYEISKIVFSEILDRLQLWLYPHAVSVAISFSYGLLFGAMMIRTSVRNRVNQARFALQTREQIISSIDDSRLVDIHYARYAQAERDEIRYKRNLSADFIIKNFRLTKASIFSDVSWNLEPGVNVLLGRNGFGKSLLLRLLVGMVSNDDDRLAALLTKPDEQQRLTVWLLKNGEPAAIERNQRAFVESVGKIPVLAVPDSRFLNRTRGGVSAEGDDNADPARDGARHFLYETPYETRLQTVLTQMCIEYVNTRARDALGKVRSRAMLTTPQLELVEDVIQELSGERFSFTGIEPIGNARFSMEVETDASPGRPITIEHASQGTLSVIAIFGLIYQFLAAVHPNSPASEIKRKSGIVIIDEVDAHLHPAWQRKIVELLRGRFPKVQFILTAHSPLVVAGCRSGEVALLRREESVLKIVDFQRDFVGATPEEIYRHIFEIEDRDVRFLELQAQLPQLPTLIRELEAKRGQKNADVAELEKTIKSIKRTQKDQAAKLEYEALQQENEQLRRQLEAAQRKLNGSGGTS